MSFFKPANSVCQQKAEHLLERVTEAVLLHLGRREVVSVLLIGSLARGEGAWKLENGGFRILSDLDVFVITRWHQRMPIGLQSAIEGIQRETGIDVDVRIAPRPRLLFYPKGVDTLDMREHNISLYGQDASRWLPVVDANAIDHTDIAFSFFNEVILSVEELSPADVAVSDEGSLSRLSHRAAKTLLICASMVCIHLGSYQPSMTGRLSFIISDRLASLPIADKAFLEDLRSAYAFRFDQPHLLHLPDALAYWHRARHYLLEIFRFCLGARYGTREISAYPRLAYRDMPPREWVRDIYKRFHTVSFLLKRGHVPRWSGWTSSTLYCKMAALMLYLAIGVPLDAVCVSRAEAYLSKLYLRRPNGQNGLEAAWCRTRDELMTFHRHGVF